MNEFQRYLAEEFAEDYQEGRISRREALRLIISVTGSVTIASSILAACTPAGSEAPLASPIPTTGTTPTAPAAETTEAPQPTLTQIPAGSTLAGADPTAESPVQSGTVSPEDPSIKAEPVQFSGEDGAELQAYLARPAGEGAFAVVLVCHENRGLTPHIQDVTRRLAKAGYAALAVDLLSRSGGTPSLSNDEVPGILGNTPPDQFVQDFLRGWQYMDDLPYTQAERVGMVGFCFGGGVTWRMATRMPELQAAVPFYGPHPPLEDVLNIQAAVLGIYGGLDNRINQGIPAIEEAMQQNNKTFEKIIYPNVDHAFHNDTAPRYNPEAAGDAWRKTLEWFERYLA
jgi:carboxymethylenebutenolidase